MPFVYFVGILPTTDREEPHFSRLSNNQIRAQFFPQTAACQVLYLLEIRQVVLVCPNNSWVLALASSLLEW